MEKSIITEKKERLYYLDNLKCFAMVLVILGHCYFHVIYPTANDVIHTFHVPIFYLISGMILGLKATKVKKLEFNLLSKIKAYMIPYFVFSLLYAIVVSVFKFPFGKDEMLKNFKDLVVNLLRMDGGATATWFLPCLLVAEILFILEQRHLRKYQMVIVNVIIYLIISFFPVSTYLSRNIFRVFFALVVLSIGYFLYIYKGKLFNLNIFVSLCIVCMLLVLYSLLFNFNGQIYAHTCLLGKFPLLGIFEFFTISLALLMIFVKFFNKKIKFVSYFGKNTLIVLSTQQIIIEILWVIDINTLNITSKLGIALPFVLTIIVIVIEFIVIWFCNKYLYFLFGKRKHIYKNKNFV